MEFLSKLLGKDSSSAAKIALFATAVVATGTVAYYVFGGSSKHDSNILPAVTEEEALEMMSQIMDKIKVLIPKMLRAADGIKQQLAQQGQEIDDMQLMKTFILPHVKEQFDAIQAGILEQYEYDDDELEEAVQFYILEGNEKLAEISDKIKSIYKEFGGDVEVDAPEASEAAQGLSEDNVVELMQGLSDKMAYNTDIFCSQFIENFGAPTTIQGMEQFQMGLMQIADGAEKELLGSHGLSQQDFQAILMQYQSNRKIIEIFTSMQYDNKRILAKHGINMGM